MADLAPSSPRFVIMSLSGNELLQFKPTPTVRDLKQLISESGYMPLALQKLVREDAISVCCDDEALESVSQSFILLLDETPLWFWESQSNPAADEFTVDGNIVTCQQLSNDYVNVLTKEPISTGLHYFEFHLHYYGDEQWCGLTADTTMAGGDWEKAIPSKKGWMYYTGRSEGAIEAMGKRLKKCSFVGRSGNVIGMLVDCDAGAVAFDVNGKIQGACEIPKNTPLWLLTHLDTTRDHVELRKPSIQDAPPTHFDDLKGALLLVSQGEAMSRQY